MRRLLLIVFSFEIGFALIVVPWSTLWDRNYFAAAVPFLHAVMINNFVRGAVSGLGVVNIVAGILELVAIFAARQQRDAIVSIRPHAAED